VSLVLGGMLQRQDWDNPVSASIEMITASTVCTPAMPPLPGPRYAASAALLGSRVYHCGGENGEPPYEFESSCHSFPLGEGAVAWEEEASMSSPRKYFGLTTVGSSLFATGGMAAYPPGGPGVYLSSVEAWAPATGWRAARAMAGPRYKHCAAALDTTLYVIGGGLGGEMEASRSVEAWDTSSSAGWEARASLPAPRMLHACQAGQVDLLQGIFVAGGIEAAGEDKLTSVEFYLTELDTWRSLAPLTTPRSSFSLSLVAGRVAAAAGHSWHTLDSVEVLEEGEWVEVGSLSTTRYFHASVSVPGGLLVCSKD